MLWRAGGNLITGFCTALGHSCVALLYRIPLWNFHRSLNKDGSAAYKVNMKKWFSIISPCVLTALVSLYGIIYGYLNMDDSGGWSYITIIIFGPIFIAVIIVDIITKLIFKQKPFHIWGVELLALGIIYLVWLTYYF